MDGSSFTKGVNWVGSESYKAAGSYCAGYITGLIIKSDPKMMGTIKAVASLAHSILTAVASLFISKESNKMTAQAFILAPISIASIVAMRHFKLIAQLGTAVYSIASLLGFVGFINLGETLRKQGK